MPINLTSYIIFKSFRSILKFIPCFGQYTVFNIIFYFLLCDFW